MFKSNRECKQFNHNAYIDSCPKKASRKQLCSCEIPAVYWSTAISISTRLRLNKTTVLYKHFGSRIAHAM